jgi:protein-L-isoaspartate(D-aspartate) O-methyltransferase
MRTPLPLLGVLASIGCSRSGANGVVTDQGSLASADAGAESTVAAEPSAPPGAAPLTELDPPEMREARERLVRAIQLEDPWDGSRAWDPRVLAAMRAVPRHLFMPGASRRVAYADEPAPIGHGQTISQPTIVAIMSDALDLTGEERVLEIGTGSGYQAAVLAMLAREVHSIEIVEPLGNAAKKRLAELGYHNVHVRVGDGYLGWPEKAPFDRVILTAAPPEIPKALIDQTKEGGMLVAPVGEDGRQRLVRWVKTAGGLKKQDLGAVRFVPMVPGSGRD